MASFDAAPESLTAQSLTKWGPTSFDVRARSDVILHIKARAAEVAFLPEISSIVSVISSHLYLSLSKLSPNLGTAKTVSGGVACREERK